MEFIMALNEIINPALDDLIDNFEQRNYRALIVIKDNKLAIKYYYNSFWENSSIFKNK